MTDGALLAVAWILCTSVLAVFVYRAALWSIPYVVSDRVLSGIRKRANSNILIHRPPNTAGNCRIPMAIADALISVCAFDVTEHPLRIHATVPRGLYWSISFYARNTDNFFVLNDMDAGNRYGEQLTFVLRNDRCGYQGRGDEIVIVAPSETGAILLRMIVPDPTDQDAVARLSRIQRLACAEEIDQAASEESEPTKYRVEVITPHDEIHVCICSSIDGIQQMIRRNYDHVVSLASLQRGKAIQLSEQYRMVFDTYC